STSSTTTTTQSSTITTTRTTSVTTSTTSKTTTSSMTTTVTTATTTTATTATTTTATTALQHQQQRQLRRQSQYQHQHHPQRRQHQHRHHHHPQPRHKQLQHRHQQHQHHQQRRPQQQPSLLQQIQYPSVSCSTPIIALIPGTTSLSRPAQYRKSQDFSIESNIRLNFHLNPQVITTSSVLFIPARTLDYGIYELKLNVTMTNATRFSSIASIFVNISETGITANLVPLGTSVVTSGHSDDLKLDPGSYSIDPDGLIFNGNDWNYTYSCRPYDMNNSTALVSFQLIDEDNNHCFINNRTSIRYSSSKSSVTILAGSLAANQSYQFVVYMVHRQNPSFQAIGYVIVQIEDTKPKLIAIACVISTMCALNRQFQFINPTTQVALFSLCIGNCTLLERTQWFIYEGIFDESTGKVEWSSFASVESYKNQIFGISASNLTATNYIFLNNPDITYWRFEVVYFFPLENTSSSLNFIISQPPQDGFCSINPMNGTTSTVFTIVCSDWFDDDGIKDYSFYVGTTDASNPIFLGSTPESSIQVRLPSLTTELASSSINIFVHIRDILNSITKFDLDPVAVFPDLEITNSFVDILQLSNTIAINTHPIAQLLASQNQNTIGQILTSIAQVLNDINQQNIQTAVTNGVPATSIFVASLTGIPLSSNTSNASTASQYFNEQLNKHANSLDYLISFADNLPIHTIEHIKLQASTLAKLTESTNQLTRKVSLFASTKCHELADALQSLTTKTTFEDIELAATYITTCGTNALTAINGPLQARGTILDMDYNRANVLPDDYDTDLENEWSNYKLFSDGNDVSWATLQYARNNYYQKQQANIIAKQVNETLTFVTTALKTHLNIGQRMTINTPSVSVSLQVATMKSLSNKLISSIGGAKTRLPSIINSNHLDQNTSILLRSVIQPLASAGDSPSQTNTNLSLSNSFSILDTNGHEIPISATIDQLIELIIPRDPNIIIPPMALQNVTLLNTHNRSFHLHYNNLTQNNNLTISFHIEIHPLNASISYLFIYNFDDVPQLNQSIDLMDGWSVFCPLESKKDNTFTYFLDNQRVSKHQSIIFGLRELNSVENQQFCWNNSNNTNSSMIFNDSVYFSSNYELRTYTSACYYLDSNLNWQSDGLIVGPQTTFYRTQCFSTHLTTFAAGLVALPAPIDWSYVFANADFLQNRTIYLTVICVMMIYLILLIYSHFQDKKDLAKLGVTVLPDNKKVDQYFYQIIVFTGHRKDSGTKSKVHFVMAGDVDETGIRTFADPNRKILQRGGIDTFIMTVPKSLGPLNYLHIWHDNTGKSASASWFLKYIIVRDLQTMIKSDFICQQWFAVEKDDGIIERLLPVAGDDEKQKFAHLLSKQAYHSFSEGHLWFSILSRPASSKFTRIQRCTCCFVLLCLTMLFNIIYYDQARTVNSTPSNAGVSIGPLYVTSNQIGTGILVELLSLLPSLLLVQLFRRTRQRPANEGQLSLVQQALVNINARKQSNGSVNKKKQSSFTFPWWCIFIAYGLSFLIIGISIFFTIIRGIQFGDLTTRKWLTSFIIGFFSSICFTQPIKIISGHVVDDDDDFELCIDEEHSHATEIKKSRRSRWQKTICRLRGKELDEARQLRLNEIKTWISLREFFVYFCFLSMLYVLTYSNQNQNAFLQVKHLQNYFFNEGDLYYDYTNIKTVDEYWAWLENSFVENIRAQQWYNEDVPRDLKGFIDDKSNRLIGWATVRQLRVEGDLCAVRSGIKNLNLTCEKEYSLFHEEQRSFQPGWINGTSMNYSASIRSAFVYRSSKELDTYLYMGEYGTYSSGGYVYEFRGRLADLRSNLSELHQLNWIDDRTRAVLIQLNLYNPNVQMFTSVIFLCEFLVTGGVFSSARFEPLSFQDFSSLFQLILAMIYMMFIAYYMISEIKSIVRLKRRYFREFWSYFTWVVIICSLTIIGIFVWRYREISRISNLFGTTNGDVYVNLQFAAHLNNILNYLFGISCFFGTVKCLYFCRCDQRLSLLGDTLQHASRDLLAFMVMFSTMFLAFVLLFYLLFVSKIWSCSSLLHTTQMLFEIILMKFDVSDIYAADSFLGPVCFTTFIFFVVFVGMTMFISIISDSFRIVRNSKQHSAKADSDMMEFMWKKFLRWTGINKSNNDERNSQNEPQYHSAIELFPQKIDQLFDAIERIYDAVEAQNAHDKHAEGSHGVIEKGGFVTGLHLKPTQHPHIHLSPFAANTHMVVIQKST
ncbi:hypothetical protein I4U23_004503, partial [Adineta vaga]